MGQLHIVLIPLMSQGHMIPMVDMAKLFISRGIKVTVIATPPFADPITRAQQSGHDIGLRIVGFPPPGTSLPDNVVSLDQVTPDLTPKFSGALALLQEPVEKLLQELHPDYLVSDMFLPWTTDTAAKFGIRRLIFHGISCLALCAEEEMIRHKPYKKAVSDSDPFVLPTVPGQLTFVRTQVAQFARGEGTNEFTRMKDQMTEAEETSYGIIVNSFYELESAYADYYRTVLGRKAWFIGPLVMHLQSVSESDERAQRGKTSAIDKNECLAWLDSKPPDSVVYICFGSMADFAPAQLHEMAVGLKASGQDFIWVLRNEDGKGSETWMPHGYEERIKDKGMIIRGWAPQVVILEHPAIGAFVTHCGWNSMLEGICAGVPMVTWPLYAEQFYNEKLATEVLRIGISVGSKKWQRVAIQGVAAESVTEAVRGVMEGEAANEMRSRAKCYKDMARKAVEEGGSSHIGLSALIDELKVCGMDKN